jgi:hypothetical protein
MEQDWPADEFYVGYAPRPPRQTARLILRVILGLPALAVALALLLIFGQHPFAKATFEFGKERDFFGVLESRPYPALLVPRPNSSEYSRYLLVGQGKHGADAAVRDFIGQQVTLRGSLIYRDGHTMIELVPGSLRERGQATGQSAPVTEGTVTVKGEIVDSKCYLGVMNPGRSKVHRDCAARCISGGIPPALVTADGLYLLVGADGRKLNHEILGLVSETVEVTGIVERAGDTLVLRADPAGYRRVRD